MKFSLLYRTEASPTGTIGETVFSHCALDRTVERFCPDKKRARSFLNVLKRPLICAADIRYRMEILEDLSEHPNLEPILRDWALRFEELHKTHRDLRRESRRAGGSERDELAIASNVQTVQAICLKRAILFLRQAYELMDGTVRSEGFTTLRQNLSATVLCPEAEELISLCNRLEGSLLRESAQFRVTLSKDGVVERCDPRWEKESKPTSEKKGFSLFRRERAQEKPSLRDTSRIPTDVLLDSIQKTTKQMEHICNELFERFGSIGEELSFYRTVLQYKNAFNEKGIALFFPEPTDGQTEISGMKDLLLLFSQPENTVVANDFYPTGTTAGTFIFGPNSGGKTVFLRSLLAAQILAQGGVPLPYRAKIHPEHRIESIFAQAEKDTKQLGAGRFEQEVRELAEVVKTAEQGTILFLNEPFQSTDPKEGAEGLAHILRYLSEQNVTWIVVSHLHPLRTKFTPEEVAFLSAREGYKILPDNR